MILTHLTDVSCDWVTCKTTLNKATAGCLEPQTELIHGTRCFQNSHVRLCILLWFSGTEVRGSIYKIQAYFRVLE